MRPAGAALVFLRILAAAVQNDDERCLARQVLRDIGEHLQPAGLVPKP